MATTSKGSFNAQSCLKPHLSCQSPLSLLFYLFPTPSSCLFTSVLLLLSSFHQEHPPLVSKDTLVLLLTLTLFTKMALILNASFSSLLLKNSSLLLSSSSFPNTSASFLRVPTHDPLQSTLSGSTRKIRYFYSCFEKKREFIEAVDESEEVELMDKPKMTLLYSFIPLPLLFTAALPGGKINTLLLPPSLSYTC